MNSQLYREKVINPAHARLRKEDGVNLGTDRRSPARALDARPNRLAKRAFDLTFAGIAALLTGPVLLLALIAIRIESPGSPIYRQSRLGRGGQPFDLYKLRGMYRDSLERFPEWYAYDSADIPAPGDFYFHRGDADDPRVTRVGRFCRRYSIDELPNFWNVLRGEMSVVGPRPEIPELAHLYGCDLDEFLSIRPGVTSPAKAVWRDDLSFAETLELELDYVRTRSLLLDLKVVWQTASQIIRAPRVR